VAPYEARERADRFRRQNVAVLEELMPPLRGRDAAALRGARGARAARAQFAEDKAALDRSVGTSWSAETEKADERAPAPAEGPTATAS